MKEKEIENYKKARAVAEQLAEVVQCGDEQSNLENYPEIEEWILSNNHSDDVLKNISNSDFVTEFYLDNELCRKNATRLKLCAEEQRRSVVRKRILLVTSSVAAALLIISLFVYNSTDKIAAPEKIVAENQPLIEPTLILSDGQTINLADVNDIVDTQSDVKIQKNKKNQLSYNSANSSFGATQYNTILIPKMTVYDVILADGTVVTLNANSELKYPTTFNGEKREVFLKGEAYFNVTKSDKQFVVRVDNVSVAVYGTSFNINSYNLNLIQTTLVQGSVGILLGGGKEQKEILLKPNQMAEINRETSHVNVSEVDVDRYTAWVDSFIRNDNESVENLLKSFSRWYGVEFEYGENVKTIKMEASFDGKRPLEEALEALEILTGLKVTKKGGNHYIVQ